PYRSKFGDNRRELFGNNKAHVFLGRHVPDDVHEHFAKFVDGCFLCLSHIEKCTITRQIQSSTILCPTTMAKESPPYELDENACHGGLGANLPTSSVKYHLTTLQLPYAYCRVTRS